LCEVDFEELTDKEKHKLFVGLTRGQVRVDVVMSPISAYLLMNKYPQTKCESVTS
jgi:hypothetical protein